MFFNHLKGFKAWFKLYLLWSLFFWGACNGAEEPIGLVDAGAMRGGCVKNLDLEAQRKAFEKTYLKPLARFSSLDILPCLKEQLNWDSSKICFGLGNRCLDLAQGLVYWSSSEEVFDFGQAKWRKQEGKWLVKVELIQKTELYPSWLSQTEELFLPKGPYQGQDRRGQSLSLSFEDFKSLANGLVEVRYVFEQGLQGSIQGLGHLDLKRQMFTSPNIGHWRWEQKSKDFILHREDCRLVYLSTADDD